MLRTLNFILKKTNLSREAEFYLKTFIIYMQYQGKCQYGHIGAADQNRDDSYGIL